MPENFTPFKNIGLCFSGGGYRATFFSLGAAAYLDKAIYKDEPLLKNVIALSTVSGGTLFGVAFAKAVTTPNFKFDDFYAEMYNTFNPAKDILLQSALAKLLNKKVWDSNTHKRQSLINAFALNYSEMPLFSGLFSDLKFNRNNSYRLSHVCFNATDFSYGLPFRFQNSGTFGNAALKGQEINMLKDSTVLGDIVASSSCFPLGFEPLIFPDDFYNNHILTSKDTSKAYKNLKQQYDYKKGVGIMDGGITDNQGIDSMLNINNRKNSKLDLIIINDVSSFQMEPWVPSSKTSNKGITVNDAVLKLIKWLDLKVLYVLVLFTGLGILGFGIFGIESLSTSSWLYGIGGFITGVGALLTSIGFLLRVYKKHIIKWIISTFNKVVPEVLREEVHSFRTLNIDIIKQLFIERATSSATMLQSVFLNQIRRLNYDNFYKNPNLENQRITSRVDQLDGKDTCYKKFKIDTNVNTPVSEALKKVANIAAETPTTLWWDEKDVKVRRMDSLIACGQFTTCYNLLIYIIELKKANIRSVPLKQLESQLRADWKLFNENPYSLV
jgi:hypothetical protein